MGVFSRKSGETFPYINGSRGRYLLLSGLIYILVGVSFLSMPANDFRIQVFQWIDSTWGVRPGVVIGPMWLTAGLGVMTGAFFRRPADRWAFAAAWAAPSVMTFFYVVGYVFTLNPIAILAIGVYVFFSLMSVIVSGMEGDEERDYRLRRDVARVVEEEERRHRSLHPGTNNHDEGGA